MRRIGHIALYLLICKLLADYAAVNTQRIKIQDIFTEIKTFSNWFFLDRIDKISSILRVIYYFKN